MPLYPLTAGLTQKIFASSVEEALKISFNNLPEVIPVSVRQKYKLPQIAYSLKNIHFPTDLKSYQLAERRLKFEEFFIMQCGLLMKKGITKRAKTHPAAGAEPWKFYNLLSFTPTNAQKRVIEEIYDDLKKNTPMNRLVQGDVGCGKTIVAAFAAYSCACAGYQSVLMVPSEILATQHYESLSNLFGEENVLLLSGKLTPKEKKVAYERIASGEVKITWSDFWEGMGEDFKESAFYDYFADEDLGFHKITSGIKEFFTGDWDTGVEKLWQNYFDSLWWTPEQFDSLSEQKDFIENYKKTFGFKNSEGKNMNIFEIMFGDESVAAQSFDNIREIFARKNRNYKSSSK